jgi:hypothetical protein
MAACKGFLVNDSVDRFEQGLCVGTIEILHTAIGSRACIGQVSTETVLHFVIRYIASLPAQRLQEPFVALASEALFAWPCRRPLRGT